MSRAFLAAGVVFALSLPAGEAAGAQDLEAPPGANLALVAEATTSFVSGHETITALNNGAVPAHSDDKRRGAYGNWPRRGTQWVQYEWSRPIATTRTDVYWFDDQRGVRLPKACRLLYWDGSGFAPVPGATGPGLEKNRFNAAVFPEVTTTKLRLEMDGEGDFSTGILQWRVYDSGRSPNFAPLVAAGVDRVVVLPGRTFLRGAVRDDGKPAPALSVRWTKRSGPGAVAFADPAAAVTTARFAETGNYVLELAADDGELRGSDTVRVRVDGPPPAQPLEPLWAAAYAVTSPFWRARTKSLIVNWIPHCVRKIEEKDLREGGLENFVAARRKLDGATDVKHVGAPFSNAWVYNTVESICAALMLDARGDEEIAQAQAAMRATLEKWIPVILAAQEPDGYLQTMYTINGARRWSNKYDHEGYNAGYFIDAALAHWWATGGKDTRLYDAARRLADCWCANIGPAPKRRWYEGHQALEMALMGLARFVEAQEGPGKGRAYAALAKFLCDSRGGGEEYDQSHLPVVEQYEAVGHAVRAVYSYAAMVDVAMDTADLDYHSAAKSLWHSIVHRKYYVTGGIGSGETSEGFGKDYSLPHHAYCESCAGCGEVFFQHRMQLAYGEACYADLLEETLYNAVLGGMDLDGRNFTYTNPLDSSERRYPWHVCPCCVGNLPRTLLRLPLWMYSKGAGRLYVNQFVGSDVALGEVEGVPMRIVQTTDYPWRGEVSIELIPAAPARFTLLIRVPDRGVSALYRQTPEGGGLEACAVNGVPVTPALEKGYAAIAREWKAGDRVTLRLPLPVQRIKASDLVAATAGRVALRRGALIYNIESVDQDIDAVLPPEAPLTAEWREGLLGGVVVLKGVFADGKPVLAVPNYARLNRGGRSLVWIKDR